MNPTNFLKMAHGDLDGLRQLASDFFNDTRNRMSGWGPLIASGNIPQVREELHRCKGGASLFALERLVALLGSLEHKSALESGKFDIVRFETELSAAEKAVQAMKMTL